ncbi:MAG: glycosyltransferase, partial [Caldilineaceae bacterium]
MHKQPERAWQSQALAIVPTYNERENIEALVRALRAQPGNLHVLVVDDNSPDGTAALVQALMADDAAIHLLQRPGKLGLGTAYKAGFGYGLAHGF